MSVLLLTAAVAALACPPLARLDLLASEAARDGTREALTVCVYGALQKFGGSQFGMVTVYGANGHAVVLGLPAGHEDDGGPQNAGHILVADFNFDGRLDVAVSWMVAGANASYHVWIARASRGSLRLVRC